MRTLIVIFLLLLGSQAFAEVYRSIDRNGNVIFSDEPSEGAEKIEVKEPMTIPSSDVPTFTYSPNQKNDGVYKSVEIVSPKNNETVRENSGNVSIKVAVVPKIQYGHILTIYLDGKEVSMDTPNSADLKNLDRGTHQARAVIKDRSGNIVFNSKTVSFHLLRHSVLHPKPKAN